MEYKFGRIISRACSAAILAVVALHGYSFGAQSVPSRCRRPRHANRRQSKLELRSPATQFSSTTTGLHMMSFLTIYP